jgi:hypothetical protein
VNSTRKLFVDSFSGIMLFLNLSAVAERLAFVALRQIPHAELN